jgi:hypothetical protein
MFYSHKWVCSVVEVVGNVSGGEMTTTKVVDFQKLCTSVVDNFLIWYHPSNKITFEFLTFEIQIFKRPWMEKRPKQKLYISKSYTTL